MRCGSFGHGDLSLSWAWIVIGPVLLCLSAIEIVVIPVADDSLNHNNATRTISARRNTFPNPNSLKLYVTYWYALGS